jgi:O-antigen/teichoic acid export membrane protein/thymidylate kinase
MRFRLAPNLKPTLSVHARQPHPTTMKPIACDDSAVAFGNAADLKAAPKVSNFLDALFNLLNESAIQYCVLRAPAAVAAAGSEILELAVHPEHRRELAALFYGLPRERFRPVQRLNVAHGTDQFHFALLDGSRPLLVRVDVQYPRICALLSAVEDELFGRSQWQGKCWMVAPTDEFSYLLAKTAQRGALTGSEEESLKLSVEALGRAEAEKVAGRLFGLQIQSEVVVACSSGSFNAILPQLRKLSGSNNLPGTIARSLLSIVGHGSRLLRNWFRPNGLQITILGPDGVGKTTLSTTIFDVFGPAFGPRKILLWRPEVLPRLSKDPSPIDPPHSKPLHGALESLARIIAIFLDYWLGHFILVKPLLSRSALILYDRDIHDILVDHRRYRYGGPRWALTSLTNILPRTESLYLILDAAPEVILKRKQEVAPVEVRRQLAAYRKLAEDLPNAYLVRTDRDLKSTTSEMAQSIVEYLSLRYKRRYVSNGAPKSRSHWTKQLQAWAATLSGTPADLKFKSRSWLQKGLLAVLDQGLISGSNFVLAILLARWLRAEQYGAYALSFAIFVLCSFLQQGLFLEPMSVFGPSVYRDAQRQYVGTLAWLQGALAGVALALSVVAVSTFLRYDTGVFRMALLGMAFSAPCVLLYWFARRAFYLQLQPGRAVGGALLYCMLLSTVVWLLARSGRLSAFTAFLAMGIAALLTSVHQLWQVRPVIFTKKKKSELKEVATRHWHYGRWAILGSMFIWIPWNVYYPIVGHFSGLAEVANLRALLNLALPVAQTLSAFSLLFLPHASHASHQENWDGAKRLALRITAFFALGTAAYWLPVCLFRAPLLQFVYAGHYSQVIRLVPWIALSSFLTGVALGPTIALRAMRSPATVSYIYFISSAVALVLGIPATRLFGISGAVICNLLSSITAAIIAWTMLARQRRPAISARPVTQEAA